MLYHILIYNRIQDKRATLYTKKVYRTHILVVVYQSFSSNLVSPTTSSPGIPKGYSARCVYETRRLQILL